MDRADALFPGLGRYLAERFGPAAAGAAAEPIPRRPGAIKKGGYGAPHVLSWRREDGALERVVFETVRPGEFGHEDRADRAACVVRAADDTNALPLAAEVLGCGALRGSGAAGLDGTGELFLITAWVEGAPYADDLERIAAAGVLGERDRARASALADYLAELHRPPAGHPTYWRRRLRDLTGSGECIAGVADSYRTPVGFVTAALLARVESLCLSWRYRLHERTERLRTVHGDFHPWNILFQEGTAFRLLDRSRGAFGDPADDVTALAVNYLFFALRTAGAFAGPFAELFRAFWRRYQERSGDAALAEVVAPWFAFRALVLGSPAWYPGESEETRRLLFRFLLSLLEAPRFSIDEIPAYLARSEP